MFAKIKVLENVAEYESYKERQKSQPLILIGYLLEKLVDTEQKVLIKMKNLQKNSSNNVINLEKVNSNEFKGVWQEAETLICESKEKFLPQEKDKMHISISTKYEKKIRKQR